jgi:hypothetical protein
MWAHKSFNSGAPSELSPCCDIILSDKTEQALALALLSSERPDTECLENWFDAETAEETVDNASESQTAQLLLTPGLARELL